ncbi:hypothetical protein [Corynebacterium frankenforstense]|uniref:hypothetical protein n=1 Tax=Corynebacterium frankenforstense TaxID=1230998 RepID=UPI0026EE1439|nr:hypothetical protein [Corynebacterium frankenforstense]
MLVKRSSDASRAVVRGLGPGAVGVAGALVLAALGVTQRPVPVVVAMAVTFIGVGATIPFTQAGLLGLELDYPGVAAGLFFFIQMAGGAAFSALVRMLGLATVPAYLAVTVIPQIVVTVMVLGGERPPSRNDIMYIIGQLWRVGLLRAVIGACRHSGH